LDTLWGIGVDFNRQFLPSRMNVCNDFLFQDKAEGPAFLPALPWR
jgi:hypothetical protein